MAGGAFQTSREIFENPIWQDVTKFRIFFFIVGNAVFSEEGVRKGNIIIQRGQFLRSYRNLQSDLEYLEKRSVKNYSLSVLKRKIEQLVLEGRLKIEDTDMGTLFTVVNYALYQGFEHYKNDDENSKRTAKEQQENTKRTAEEQQENNNKNVKKEKKVKKVKEDKTQYAEFVFLKVEEYEKLISEHGEEKVKQMIQVLDNYKGSSGKKYKDDYRAILTWVVDRVNQDSNKSYSNGGQARTGGMKVERNTGGFSQTTKTSGRQYDTELPTFDYKQR